MNVTENYLLQQMQALAVSMPNVQQTGSSNKDKTTDGSSFQDMMNQAGKTRESASASKETDAEEPVQKKDEAAELEKEPVKAEEKEELKPEQFVANPNAVNILDLFRPDVVQPEEEPVIEVPVAAVPEESVEGPDLALDGQLPEMETGVEANVDTGVSMEQQPETFQETLEKVPQEEQRPVENTETVEVPETVEAPEAAPERVVNTDKLQQPQQKEAPEEIEVQTENDEEPKAEVMETGQPVFHETESTPVKVGETYETHETVDTQQPDVEQKLTDVIQTAVQNGAERVEIRLAPQNLGSLTIEMTKDANGTLQVVLHTSNAKATGVLNQHLDGLQAALRNYSQDEVRIEVQRNDESQEQHSRQADPDGRGQQQRQQQEQHREEKHSGEAFMQKLRLGLFGTDEI